MSSWLQRLRGDHHGHDNHTDPPAQPERRKGNHQRPGAKPKDPNAPVKRLQLAQKCLYERTLPGNAFVSAHVNRLQRGYYESKALHDEPLNDVYFVSVHFVFHPRDHHSHRIKAATIKVSVHGDINPSMDFEKGWYKPPRSSPRILKHAPELIYGAVSPENLQWNFNLSSSLGVSQAPLSASLNPSGGVKRTYRVYDMMSIQGSLRVLKSPLGSEFDVDDALAVWTLEENLTQRSGLPREFDFVMLVHKPDDVNNAYLSVDLDAAVSTWYGDYPEWYSNLSRHLPIIDYTLDFNTEIGQRFLPVHSKRGFNFADLPHALEEYVNMPGAVYPTSDTVSDDPVESELPRRYRHYYTEPQYAVGDKNTTASSHNTLPQSTIPTKNMSIVPDQPTSIALSRAAAAQQQIWLPDTLNVRVTLEHGTPHSPSVRRYSESPLGHQDPARRQSIRRRRSRSELKEYGIQQALQALAGDALRDNHGIKQASERAVKAGAPETRVDSQG